MSKQQIKITARIYNYSIPSRKEDTQNSLLLAIQPPKELSEDFPLPNKILVPKSDETQPFLDDIINAIRVSKKVILNGTYTCIPPHFLNYLTAKAHKHLLNDKRSLGESAVRTYTGVIAIDDLDSYVIKYHCHKKANTFEILKTLS